MKFIVREIPTLFDTSALNVSFFFHARGHELQKTSSGLFRSLLYQLLKKSPESLHGLIWHFQEQVKIFGGPGLGWTWTVPKMQSLFELSLNRVLEARSVVLYIDALDECGNEAAANLIFYLEHFLSVLLPTAHTFSICFSCCYRPILKLQPGPTIRMDVENRKDIVKLVEARLSSNNLHREIQEAICIMPKAYSCGEALSLKQWVCFSIRPLTIPELQWAMVIKHVDEHQRLYVQKDSVDFISDGDVDKKMKALSYSLAEVVSSSNGPVVQFIHQSVKDFFADDGLILLGCPTTPQLLISTAHCYLSRSCIAYLRMAILQHSTAAEIGDPELHFLEYATELFDKAHTNG
ncbi:ankyrin repeat-containing protein [Penicillium chermesinum]|uniref:Ankyrin repeat-containing protein n=1 Tax=Penicillium chermesinum TaxID=63820 RepID=A0A9W9PH62_9EURO|nr:ankyrin repeat-containing protein [Penicillium chermesinum]KAJ5246766.1 ankyrin repeat-containing protein [Penicillium chermesinum]